MKFGVREICDVVFKPLQDTKIGSATFKKGQPVLYIDTAKTSTIEGAATTVYAQGGKGNTRLIAWEGEKTLTFTVEDALLSPIGFSVLSGAGIFNAEDRDVHVHMTSRGTVVNGKIDLSGALRDADATTGTEKEEIDETAPIFIAITEKDGSVTGDLIEGATVGSDGQSLNVSGNEGASVLVDCYIVKPAANAMELQITADKFAGYYYVEASTLFRDQDTGKDMPAEITLPKVKIQSNFTFSMASSGDPSTFTFTMDAFPDYTRFDKTKKVLAAIQMVEASTKNAEAKRKRTDSHDWFDDLDVYHDGDLEPKPGSEEEG